MRRVTAPGMHPPFFFVLPKKNAPCTVEEKDALIQTCVPCAMGRRFGDAAAGSNGRIKPARSHPAALYAGGDPAFMPHLRRGCRLEGAHRKGFCLRPRCRCAGYCPALACPAGNATARTGRCPHRPLPAPRLSFWPQTRGCFPQGFLPPTPLAIVLRWHRRARRPRRASCETARLEISTGPGLRPKSRPAHIGPGKIYLYLK